MSQSFELNGRDYQIEQFAPLKALHVTRKLIPLLSGFGAEIQKIVDSGGKIRPNVGDFLRDLGPGLEGFARLPDEDVNYIVTTSLSVVKVKVEGDRGWARLMSASDPTVPMYEIDMVTMLRIVWEVLQQNLGGFLPTPPPK